MIFREMQSVMSQISEQSKELGELQTKVDTKHESILEERETAAKQRDIQLTSMMLLLY